MQEAERQREVGELVDREEHRAPLREQAGADAKARHRGEPQGQIGEDPADADRVPDDEGDVVGHGSVADETGREDGRDRAPEDPRSEEREDLSRAGLRVDVGGAHAVTARG